MAAATDGVRCQQGELRMECRRQGLTGYDQTQCPSNDGEKPLIFKDMERVPGKELQVPPVGG